MNYFLDFFDFITYNIVMDENIYELINESKIEDVEDIGEELALDENTYLLFSINLKNYAVPSNLVKELLRDVEVFPLPFVPSYIDGVLNRYGDPYVVLDPAILFGDKKQNNSLFLVFNDENKLSIRISDVFDFYTIQVSEINKFTDDNLEKFFEGTFKYNDKDVIIIKKDAIVEKIGKDFERT